MKYLTYPLIIFLSLIAVACSTSRYRMADCQYVGEADGKKLFDCDAYHSPREMGRR